MNNETNNMKPMVNHTYLDFSILDDDMLPPLILEAKDEVHGEVKGKGREKKILGEAFNFKTLTEQQEQRRRVLVQVYGTKCPKNSLKTFPVTLMKLLSRDDLQEYISWLPHGRAFIIHQPHAFVNDVLISYFKMSKFRSFTRQLNIWEFKRINQGRDAGAYYHELFLRGRPKLALFIRRHQIKGVGTKLPSNFTKEPSFYEMNAMEPFSDCKDPHFASFRSTSVKTDDTLPRSAEKSSVTNQSAASYHSQTGSVGASNPIHGSPCPQPNACTEYRDDPDPSPSSRMLLETISLEHQRQQIMKFLQQTSQDSLKQAQQALAQQKATEDLLQCIHEAANAPHALPVQQHYLSVPLQCNNFPQAFNVITPTTIEIAPSTLLNLNILPVSTAIPETNVLRMNYPLSLAMALQQQPTTEER